MKALTVVLILCVLASCAFARAPKWHELEGYTFDKYIQDFGKNYESAEYFHRRQIFHATLKKIQAHNALTGQSYKKGVNHLTDKTVEELKRMNGYKGRQLRDTVLEIDAKHGKKHVLTGKAIPQSVDYRQANPSILTAVKDQGMCGSCWAHGTTETIESYAALATGELFVLSQQQLTACAPNVNSCGGTGGCAGSTAELAMSYLSTVAGQAQEWTYPYTAYSGTTGTCNFNNSYLATPAVVSLDFYTKVNGNDQTAVMDALANVGPLIINVDASEWSTYESGVYDACKYNISIDHVVQLVGYGTDVNLGDYWIVRNSWSASFGEAGYIRLRRDATPSCGWDVDPQDGTGCKVGPNQLWACGQCGILFDTLYPNIIAA